MKKTEEWLHALDFNELVKLKKDLDEGAIELRKQLQQRIKYREFMHDRYCNVCTAEITPYEKNTYTLIFGPHEFRKKASFCATDCMRYFLDNLLLHEESFKSLRKEEKNA